MYGRKRFLRDSLKAFVASGSVFGIITLIGPKVSKFITSPIRAAEPIISNPSISLEPVSSASPTILEPIISNPAVQEIARHLSNVPPEYIVAGLLIGTTAFTAGIYVERRRQKKKKANLPLLKPTAENYNFNNE